MIQKLRFKFVLINMSIVTIMLCVILGLVFYFTSADLERESIRMMESIAAQPFQQGTPMELGEDVRLPFFTLQLGPRGELISAGGGYYDLSDGDFLDHLVQQIFASHKRLGVLPEYNLRYYRMDTPASQYLVFADISSEMATLDGLRSTCLLIGALSFFAFLWVSILLSRWAVKPVDRAWKQQRDFVAAASHELKTPLTVIMANAELMQDPDYGEENRIKFLDNILVMSRQMRRLVEQMLTLAQTDSAQSRENFAPVNLSHLVSQSILTFEPVFYEKGLSLSVQAGDNIQVMGAPTAGYFSGQCPKVLPRRRRYPGQRGQAGKEGTLPDHRGQPGGTDPPGGSAKYFQTLLPHGQGPQPKRELWVGAGHCPGHRRAAPGNDLGGKQWRMEPLFRGASLSYHPYDLP